LVIGAALAVFMLCELGRRSLRRDAIPNLANPQIAVSVEWTRQPTLAVAKNITTKLTAALQGIPGSTAVRGSTMTGLAYVDIEFDDGN
jgi:Cu/Ag efflux pump CusA